MQLQVSDRALDSDRPVFFCAFENVPGPPSAKPGRLL